LAGAVGGVVVEEKDVGVEGKGAELVIEVRGVVALVVGGDEDEGGAQGSALRCSRKCNAGWRDGRVT
jgi:hypothetical protein